MVYVLMPFQGAYTHTTKTQGVALGYVLVGFQPVPVQLFGFGFPFGRRFSIQPDECSDREIR